MSSEVNVHDLLKEAMAYGRRLIEHSYIKEHEYGYYKDILTDRFLNHCLNVRKIGASPLLSAFLQNHDADPKLKFLVSSAAYKAFVDRSEQGPANFYDSRAATHTYRPTEWD